MVVSSRFVSRTTFLLLSILSFSAVIQFWLIFEPVKCSDTYQNTTVAKDSDVIVGAGVR